MEQRDTATNRLWYFAIVNFVLLLSLNSGKASFATVLGFCNSRLSKWRRAFKPSIAIANLFGIMIEVPKWMPKASIQPVFTTFVLTHLLMQLGNGYASMPIALVLVNNHSYSSSTSFDFIPANQFLEAPFTNFLREFQNRLEGGGKRGKFPERFRLHAKSHSSGNARLLCHCV